MELETMLKSIPDASIEEAIKQAKENMKLSNNMLLLVRRELEEGIKTFSKDALEKAINQSLEVLKKQNRFLLLARRELKRRKKQEAKCEL